MPDTPYVFAAVAVCVAITFALRALPFAVLTPLRTSAVVHYLNARMPVGVMLILTVYTLHDLSPAAPRQLVAPAIALAVTLGLHHWRHNAVLSIFGGTAVHVALASTITPH